MKPHPRDQSAEEPGQAPLVSILVVNYNGRRFLPGLLNSLSALTYPNYETVVVDNASTDDSIPILSRHSWLKLVKSPVNRGFAGGNNFGLPYCSGKYVLLLNNDVVVPPDLLEPLSAYLESHEHVGVVQGKMILPRHNDVLDVCGSFLTFCGLPYHYGYLKRDEQKYQRYYRVFSGKGACLMFRRDLVERVGGFLFDEDFFCYYEETDFCHRSWLAGFEVHFVPSPPVRHFFGGTAGGPQSNFVLQHYLPNMAFSLLSNLSPLSRVRILPWFFAVMCCSLVASLMRGELGQARAHFDALLCCVTRFRRIRARRRLVADIRRLSDGHIFSLVLRNPRLEYYMRTLNGSLASYDDGPVA